MPNKPLEAILYRELSRVEAKEAIELVSPVLIEIVNYSTNVLARCTDSASGKPDENTAVFALYRHMIELTDAIEVLISQSCPSPSIPLVRSQFEALLSLDYILESQKEYNRRSLAWLVGYIHDQLDTCDRLDPATAKGKQFKDMHSKDKTVSEAVLPSLDIVQLRRDNLLALLAKPHIALIEAEFQRLKNPEWYQLFSGLPHLRALAEYEKRGAEYDILYRQWSSVAHAQDLSLFLKRVSKDRVVIARLRDPKPIRQMSLLASVFMLEATRLVLKKFRHGELRNYGKWYLTEIRPSYSKMRA